MPNMSRREIIERQRDARRMGVRLGEAWTTTSKFRPALRCGPPWHRVWCREVGHHYNIPRCCIESFAGPNDVQCMTASAAQLKARSLDDRYLRCQKCAASLVSDVRVQPLRRAKLDMGALKSKLCSLQKIEVLLGKDAPPAFYVSLARVRAFLDIKRPLPCDE